MKKIILLLFLLVFSFSYSQKKGTTNSPSKKEAIDWLNSKFSGDRKPLIGPRYMMTSFAKFNIDGSFSIVTYYKYQSSQISDQTSYFSGNLKDLSYSSVYSRFENGIYMFYAKCHYGDCVQATSSRQEQVLLGMIASDSDSNIEQRAINAFKSTIKMYNPKKEAF